MGSHGGGSTTKPRTSDKGKKREPGGIVSLGRKDDGKLAKRTRFDEQRELYQESLQLHHYRLQYGGVRNVDPEKDPGQARRLLEGIAEEIRVRVKITKNEIFTIGGLLLEAKQLTRGEFQKWIEENLDFSYETALNFMQVYQCCFGHREVLREVKASVLYRISAPGFPEELREHLFANGGALEQMNNKQINQLVEKYKQGGFEAVREAMERMNDVVNYYDQMAYILDALKRIIDGVEKEKRKIFEYGVPGQFYSGSGGGEGGSTKANQTYEEIYDAVSESLRILWRAHKKHSEISRTFANLSWADSMKERTKPSRILLDEEGEA